MFLHTHNRSKSWSELLKGVE